MKETELRIGNYVLGKRYPEDEGETILVKSVDDSGINLEVGYGGEGITREFYHDDVFPIPLTPEILEKVGLEKGCQYSKEKGFTAPNEAFFFENDYYPKEMSSGRSIGKEIEYLHQLQNLYFALTGEELIINL